MCVQISLANLDYTNFDYSINFANNSYSLY